MGFSPQPKLPGAEIAKSLVPSSCLAGDDDQDTRLLRRMAEDAREYISVFPWYEKVLESYFAGGVGGIFAVFFFRILPARQEIDLWLWVMIGDTPPAYLPLCDCQSAAEAFRMYIRGLSKWVELARRGQKGTPEQGVPPVDLPATPEYAEIINRKVYGLTLAVQPFFENGEDQMDVVN